MGWKIAYISLPMRQIQVVNLNICITWNSTCCTAWNTQVENTPFSENLPNKTDAHVTNPFPIDIHMSGRPLQTKLPKVYILWYIPKLLGLWKRLTRRITRPLHKKTVRWMSDNDISRIVERLRPSLPQILQNQSRGTMQQTILTDANRAYIICHNWSCSSFTVIS